MRMFDRLSKPGKADADGRPGHRWIGDVSGAFGDLGTFLPLVIALLVLGRFDPSGLLIGFGLFAIITGLIYRLPMPVQPMKLVAALAIAGGLSAPAMMASGMLLGLALVILGASGLIGRMRRLVPRTVLAGLQIALGLHLLITSVELIDGATGQALLALGLFVLLLATPLRAMSCLLFLIIGIVWSLVGGGAILPPLEVAWYPPEFGIPPWSAFGEAAVSIFWPQLALTVTNAVLLTSALSADYFPHARASTGAKRLALSSGMLNLILAPVGAMPMCHGAGGLAAQYHQGARTGRAPAIFGAACLALGLFAGPLAVDFLLLVPLSVVAVLLGYASFHLLVSTPVIHANWSCRGVIAMTAIVAFAVDVAAGLATGLIIELIRSQIANLRQPTT